MNMDGSPFITDNNQMQALYGRHVNDETRSSRSFSTFTRL